MFSISEHSGVSTPTEAWMRENRGEDWVADALLSAMESARDCRMESDNPPDSLLVMLRVTDTLSDKILQLEQEHGHEEAMRVVQTILSKNLT